MKVFGLIRPRIRVVASHRIDTDRLTLRSPVAADAASISALLENWNVAHWLVRVPFPYRVEHAAAWIERSIQERAAGAGQGPADQAGEDQADADVQQARHDAAHDGHLLERTS